MVKRCEFSVVVQFRQNLSGQPYVVARSDGRHVGLPLHRCGVEIKLNHYRILQNNFYQELKLEGSAGRLSG